MKVVEITDQHVWDSFVSAHALDSGLLQSWAWGEFQQSVGHTVVRVGVYSNDTNDVQGVALVVQHVLPLGSCYWYSPRGPVIARDATIAMRVLDALTHYFHAVAQGTRTMFWRLDPAVLGIAGSCVSLQHLGFRKAPHEMQPKSTLIIDLTKSEEQLLAQMHSKTRYNIRLAEKKGVVVRNDIQDFWSLLQETATRDGFRTHGKDYYEKLLQVHGVQLFTAEHQGKIFATAMVAVFNGWALYLHGASSSENRDFMAPHLLHWRIMQEAKRRGCTKYDLWGADSARWPGVTRFKQGFGEETPITSYCGAWDYPLRKSFYKLYCLLSRIKKMP